MWRCGTEHDQEDGRLPNPNPKWSGPREQRDYLRNKDVTGVDCIGSFVLHGWTVYSLSSELLLVDRFW